MSMKITRLLALVLILLSGGISVLWSISIERASPLGMVDFKAVYYGSRCLIQHSDPYNQDEFVRIFQAEGGKFPSEPVRSHFFRRAVTVCINLPTCLFLIAPLAMLAWGQAQFLWMFFTSVSLIVAAYLMWDIGADYAPVISVGLICFFLADNESLLAFGNAAGIAVALCVVAVWCFLKDRYVPAGILCLAISLAMKPHNTGLVWLFFLLSGGVYRKRALQSFAVTLLLAIPAMIWVSRVAPHWLPELHSNFIATSARGDVNDPGPASINGTTVIDLQAVVSVFRDNPRFYNLVSYIVCCPLLLLWAVRAHRTQFSLENAWFALAAVVPLTMLVTYHRPCDVRLLLLTLPACTILWAEGYAIRWIALLMNIAGFVSAGDIPLTVYAILTRNYHENIATIRGQFMAAVVLRPISLIMLAMGIFYLWIYVRRDPQRGLP
jgi:hypothetical protein